MQKKNTLIPVILSLGLVTLAVVGGLSVYSAYNNKSKVADTATTGELNTTITAVSGINVKRLSSGTDANSNPYQVFTYETVPTYTKNACNITCAFADGRNNPTDYLTLAHDAINRTLTVTCIDAFDSQATITFTSGNASASVTVDYKQKFLSVSAAGAGGCSRFLSYDSTKYNPQGNNSDSHASLCDLLSVFYSSPLFVVNLSSTYTVAATEYTNYEFRGLSVPHGLGYVTYEDYIDTTGYSADKLSVYTDFWKPAFATLTIVDDNIGTDPDFKGIYKALNTVWGTLSDVQRQKVVNESAYASNGNVYLTVELPKIKNMTANLYFPDASRSYPYSFAKELTLSIEPMPSWNIAADATSITTEVPGITF